MHQPRRPGAAYRDHQIFRNAMQTVRGYLTQDPQGIAGKLNLKRTRSGHVYGHYADQ